LCPLATGTGVAVVATEIACGVPAHIHYHRIVILITSGAVIKVRVYIIVPGTF
jgi:hypothetical protein